MVDFISVSWLGKTRYYLKFSEWNGEYLGFEISEDNLRRMLRKVTSALAHG